MQTSDINSGKFLLSKEDYLHNKELWRKYSESKIKGNSHYYLLYLLMCEKNIFKGFSPLVKENKIHCNGNGNKYYRLSWDLYRLSYYFNNVLSKIHFGIPLREGDVGLLGFKFNLEYIAYLRDKIQKIIIHNNF